jgi:GWxTD domain-containing protein
MRSRTLAALALLFAPTFLFALSQKYKDWAASPQAYFMTKAERAQWASVVTDDDAEKFVANYVASRGPGFADQVADRVTNADKYLTIGKTKPASQTLRGKVIVLLGPPSAVKTENKKGRTDRYAPVGGYGGDSGSPGAGGGGMGGQGVSVGDMMSAAQQTNMGGKQSYVEYTISYSGETLPPAYSKGVTIKIQVDPTTGDDWVTDRKAHTDLDELFSAVIVTGLRAAAKPAQ